ncbi:hypothetical protein D3C86_1438570 [compost metagenome]
MVKNWIASVSIDRTIPMVVRIAMDEATSRAARMTFSTWLRARKRGAIARSA